VDLRLAGRPEAMLERDSDVRPAGSDGHQDLGPLLQYSRIVFLVCMRLTGNRADAEDLAQETYVRACQHPERIPAGDEAKAWLCCVARNVCRDLLRRRRFRLSVWPLLSKAVQVVDDPHSRVERSESHAALRRALAGLPRRQRDVLVLREYGDLTYEQIARSLNIKVGTVMSRMNRARRRLAAVMRAKENVQ
jgi:RNA polymerase sigma factor (sigma-70 family)